MTSSKPTGRPSNRKRTQPAGERIAALLQGWQQRSQANRRQRELRRIRQQRESDKPAAGQQVAGMRRALQFRGLQRRFQRRQLEEQTSRSPMGWLWPRAAGILTAGDAASQLMRNSATALFVASLIGLVIGAIPLRLNAPNWYMDVLGSIGETMPLLVIACVFSLLPLVVGTDNRATDTYRAQLLRRARLGYIAALLLLPLQIGFMTWLISDTYLSSRTQINAIRVNVNSMIQGARQATTTDQFVAFLRSRNLNANLESIAAAPLVQVRTEFVRSVKAQQEQGEASIKQTTNTTIVRFVSSGLRLFANLLILAIFMRSFQMLTRRSGPTGMDQDEPQEITLSHAEDPETSITS
jgi:hypothetical protein